MNYDPTNPSITLNPISSKAKEKTFINKVFNLMFWGLAASALSAFFFATNETLMRVLLSSQLLFFGLAIGLVIMVITLSANITKMSPQTAFISFMIYALLNGVLLSTIFLVYTSASIFSTFVVAAATFAAMAIYGYTTKKDLTSIGSFAFMALIGLIIAQVVNMFMHSTGLAALINYAGVLIFVALTAYDVQKIKQIGESNAFHPNYAVMGALRLYLDFINLFIHLLRIMGKRR
jgi:FtsH-binding integral membrane protein